MPTIKVRKYQNKPGTFTYRYRGKSGDLTEDDVKSFKGVEFKWADGLDDDDKKEVLKRLENEIRTSKKLSNT